MKTDEHGSAKTFVASDAREFLARLHTKECMGVSAHKFGQSSVVEHRGTLWGHCGCILGAKDGTGELFALGVNLRRCAEIREGT
jgi:hypothetical protein